MTLAYLRNVLAIRLPLLLLYFQIWVLFLVKKPLSIDKNSCKKTRLQVEAHFCETVFSSKLLQLVSMFVCMYLIAIVKNC